MAVNQRVAGSSPASGAIKINDLSPLWRVGIFYSHSFRIVCSKKMSFCCLRIIRFIDLFPISNKFRIKSPGPSALFQVGLSSDLYSYFHFFIVRVGCESVKIFYSSPLKMTTNL